MTTPDQTDDAIQGEAGVNEPSTDANGAGGNSDGSGPAPWSSYLEDLPETLRPLVEPKFKEWDANVTKKIQSLHSEYEPYKPFVEGYEPDYLQNGVQLLEALEADPKAFLQALAEAYDVNVSGIGSEQGTADQQKVEEEDDSDNVYLDPRVTQHEELLELMAQQLLAERQEKEQAAQDQQLEQTMAELKEKHGEFDEGYVLTLIANGVNPDAAVQQFNTLVQSFATKMNAPASNAPVVLGSTGGNGVPSNAVDPSTLSDKDTQKLVVELLAKANQNS